MTELIPAVIQPTFPSLEEAIAQLIGLGESDPLDIARKLEHRHGAEWLNAELAAHREEIVAEIVRRKLGQRRRTAIGSLSRVNTASRRDLMLSPVFLLGHGWVKLGDSTAEEFDRAAATYRKGAAALTRYADWFEANAALIRSQGVTKFKQVRGAIPVLAETTG